MAAAAAATENGIQKGLFLEDIDVDLFRAPQEALWRPMGSRAVFGGQVVGQALVAARKTVATHFHVHSLHSYFLRPGQLQPIIYYVTRLRDGASFTTRSVRASQAGQLIFHCTVSFHKDEPGGVVFRPTPPPAPTPDALVSQSEQIRQHLEAETSLNDSARALLLKRLSQEMPMEVRFCLPKSLVKRTARPPHELVYLKMAGEVGDDPSFHQCAAAYASDFALLAVSINPFPDFEVGMMTSLDHSIWFHAPFRADSWMLYHMELVCSGGNRSLCHGRMYTPEGVLALSVVQEGLVRPKARL